MKMIQFLVLMLFVSLAQATPKCYPVEAGGTGTQYQVAMYSEGLLYTWWCGKDPEWTFGGTKKVFTTPKELKDELMRVDAMLSYSRNPNAMKAAAASQLKDSKK